MSQESFPHAVSYTHLDVYKRQGLTRAISIQHRNVVSDPVFLREILGNLLSNAIKFTQSMGMVILVAEETSVEEEQADFTFRVKDSGCGISEENKDVIFDAFERGEGENISKPVSYTHLDAAPGARGRGL